MKVIRANGTPRELGRQVGEATREEIALAYEFVLGQASGQPGAQDYLGHMLAETAMRYPAAVQYLLGLAEGAGRPSVMDVALTAFSEELSWSPGIPKERCTTLVANTKDGWVLGHNEDYDPFYLGKMFVLVEGDTISLNYPGQLPHLGPSLNRRGFSMACNSLSAPSRLGPSLQARFMHAQQASCRIYAVQALQGPSVLASHFTVVDEYGATSLEVANTDIAEADEDTFQTDETFFHTNHALRLKFREGMEHTSESSHRRYEALAATVRDGYTPNSASEMFSFLHRPDGVICKTPKDDSNSCTLATVVTCLRTRTFSVGVPGEKRLDFRF